LKARKHFVEIQIKDNAFVKCAPTTKTAYLIETSPTILRMRVISQAKDVPYSDCFKIEEDFICTMPEGCNSSSILRVTMNINWMKSTMMKGIIMSSSVKESKAVWASYSDYIKKNGHIWKEKKKEIKLNHGIEKATIKLLSAND